jgi:hypothetical protein
MLVPKYLTIVRLGPPISRLWSMQDGIAELLPWVRAQRSGSNLCLGPLELSLRAYQINSQPGSDFIKFTLLRLRMRCSGGT